MCLLTGRNEQDQDGKQNHVGANARHSKDGTKNRHGYQEEGEGGVELLLLQAVGSGPGRRVQAIRAIARDNSSAKGEPKASKEAEDGGWKGVA